MAKKEFKENKTLALLLSFLIAVAGSILWGLVYTFGWFVSIVSYLTAFAMFIVYSKFCKKIDKTPIVWTLVWLTILNTIASLLSVVIYVAIQANVSFGVAFNAVFGAFADYAVSFVLDMILGVVFGVLGIVSYYQYHKRQKMVETARAELFGDNMEQTENIPTTDENGEPIVDAVVEKVEQQPNDKE